MNFKLLLLPAVALVPAMSMADNYYVTPDGNGTKDGSGWENAMGVTELIAQAKVNKNGDVYYLGGGVYKPEGTIVFATATGAVINGSADGERTIFNGDQNGNNNPDYGDLSRLIRFQSNTVDGDASRPVVIKDVDFTCVYTTNSESGTGNGNTSYTMGALMFDNSGDVLLEGCNFYSCWSEGQYGGPCLNIRRSTVTARNCVFRDNSANYRSAVIRVWSDNANKGVLTLDGCVLKNNTNYHNNGGVIFAQHCKALNIVNSTIYGNKAVANGSAIFLNLAGGYTPTLNIVGSTIANNAITGDAEDGQIYISNAGSKTAKVDMINSVVVADNANTGNFVFSGLAETEVLSFVSAGWNYVGANLNEADVQIDWQSTDRHGDDCTYAAIFGTNTINGDNVVAPAKFFAGATGEQTAGAVSGWGLPAGVNVTVDQLGNDRVDNSNCGAYVDKSITTGIGEVTGDSDVRLTVAGDGVYCLEGASAPVEVYNLQGCKVAASAGNTVSIADKMPGVYVIKSGNVIFKIVK